MTQAPPQPRMVLVVDDDDAVRDAFSRVLRFAGFVVTPVANGVAALREIARSDFEIVVSDFSMPELSGQGFYEQLEERFPAVAARVLFVTAYADNPAIRKFLDETGQPVLMKPVDPQVLVAEVKQMVARNARRHSSPGYGL